MSSLPRRRMIDAPDFWRLWYVGLIVSTVRWVETVAIGVVVYQRTDLAFLVSMMTMLRLLPMGLFGVFLGALAERFDRGKTLLLVVLLMSVTSVVLVILDRTGQLEIWHLALASFINGCGRCTDNPVRRVMIGEVVGPRTDRHGDVAGRGRQQCEPDDRPRRRLDSCSPGRAFEALLFWACCCIAPRSWRLSRSARAFLAQRAQAPC